MASTVANFIALDEVAPNEYVSKFPPPGLGRPIAFGGCALGLAVHAAGLTVSPKYQLYSVLGHYLGPGSLDEKMKCTVERTRDTRSFATRRVRVTQTQPGGKTRTCMELTADFRVAEDGGLTYSAPPVSKIPPVDTVPTNEELVATLFADGRMSPEQGGLYNMLDGPLRALMEVRQFPDSVGAQNLTGLLKPVPTSQDHLPIHAKVSAEWVKLREKRLDSQQEQMAALAFCTDLGLSILPFVHSDLRLDQLGLFSSLDFALRVMQPVFDSTKWHISERRTSNAAGGITYSETRLWNDQGIMVASMTQQSVFRVERDPKPAL
ncbi:acyl-CoA thioesterase II [Xylariales sp. PMI_506]|nr:acyl-CoA thioesterase II [Xylariales sp. PMI_506]